MIIIVIVIIMVIVIIIVVIITIIIIIRLSEDEKALTLNSFLATVDAKHPIRAKYSSAPCT